MWWIKVNSRTESRHFLININTKYQRRSVYIFFVRFLPINDLCSRLKSHQHLVKLRLLLAPFNVGVPSSMLFRTEKFWPFIISSMGYVSKQNILKSSINQTHEKKNYEPFLFSCLLSYFFFSSVRLVPNNSKSHIAIEWRERRVVKWKTWTWLAMLDICWLCWRFFLLSHQHIRTYEPRTRRNWFKKSYRKKYEILDCMFEMLLLALTSK